MTDLLVDLLNRHGPMSSAAMAEKLTASGLTPAAARQRISRRSDVVRALEGLPLSRRGRYLYLTKQYGTPVFWTRLIRDLETVPGAYSRALAAVRARGGILPATHFSAASGAPVQMARRLAAEEVILRLVSAGLLDQVHVEGVGPCIAFARGLDYLQAPIAEMQARLITERIVLDAVKTWGKRLALGSFNRFELRGDAQPPRVGAFEFDLTAPSYVSGLAIRAAGAAPKPGFLVCDVLMRGEVSLESLKPFLHKCTSLTSGNNMPRCFPIFVADRFAPNALAAARSAGVIAATIEMLFGQEVASAVKELSATLSATAERAADPEKFAKMFDVLTVFEGAAGTLRGALFEFVVNELAKRALHATRTVMNRRIRENGVDVAEIDVMAVVEDRQVHFIECKGIAVGSTVDDAEVKRWLHMRIPAIRRWALQQEDLRHLQMSFELWSSGVLTRESEALVDRMRATARKYKIVWRGADELESVTEAAANVPLLRVVRDHFLRAPRDWGPT